MPVQARSVNSVSLEEGQSDAKSHPSNAVEGPTAFCNAMLEYVRTGDEADLHAASNVIAQLLLREDNRGIQEAMNAVQSQIEQSIVNTSGQRALELSNAMQAPLWLTAFSTPALIRRLRSETAERRTLEEDGRAAILMQALERERLELRVCERTVDLSTAKAELEAIISLASHDLRTPANAIELSSRALQDEMTGSESEHVRTLVDDIRSNAQRILSRLGAFVDLCRAEERHEDWVTIDLESVIDTAWGQCQVPAHVSLVKSIGLHEACLEPGIMQAIFMELFNNAIVHGGPNLSIVSARTHACGGMAIMEIADNGQGVPDADRERIFLPFEKLNQRLCDEFVGVGLALVHKFLQLRSSAITCGTDAELGGACFKIALPQKYYAN